jgi:hypothetical protein
MPRGRISALRRRRRCGGAEFLPSRLARGLVGTARALFGWQDVRPVGLELRGHELADPREQLLIAHAHLPVRTDHFVPRRAQVVSNRALEGGECVAVHVVARLVELLGKERSDGDHPERAALHRHAARRESSRERVRLGVGPRVEVLPDAPERRRCEGRRTVASTADVEHNASTVFDPPHVQPESARQHRAVEGDLVRDEQAQQRTTRRLRCVRNAALDRPAARGDPGRRG